MSNPDKFTKNVRYRTASFGVINNGAQSLVTVSTPDDAERRILTGMIAVNTVLGVNIQILRTGYRVTDFDEGGFTKLTEMQVLDEDYPSGIQMQVNIVNESGGATTADAIVLRYELPDHIG